MAGRETVSHLGAFRALPFVEHMVDHDLELLDQALSSTIDGEQVGAVILEPTQGEGGARPFDPAYLGAVRALASVHDVVVIADEVQAGVGRTGPFFAFEGSALDPDIICVSKSISGLGLPMAVNLVRRSLDRWTPGEFTGTFRGNNLAFATSATMLETYWSDAEQEKATEDRGVIVRSHLSAIAEEFSGGSWAVRGNGMLSGLEVSSGDLADAICDAAFADQLIVETCGAGGATIKVLAPIVIDLDDLHDGLGRLHRAVATVTSGS